MPKSINIEVCRRTDSGKGPNRRLRAAGRIPAVLYGTGAAPEKVALDARAFDRAISTGAGENAILNVVIADSGSGKEETAAILREIQRDPVTRRVLHADLYRIRLDVENDFEVPLHGVGIPIGVREGGILEAIRRTIEVRCLPANLPNAINVDLLGLRVNNSIHVRDIEAPEGVTILSGADEVLFTVAPPKEAPAAATAEGEEAQQPEVIGKKKEEEGEG